MNRLFFHALSALGICTLTMRLTFAADKQNPIYLTLTHVDKNILPDDSCFIKGYPGGQKISGESTFGLNPSIRDCQINIPTKEFTKHFKSCSLTGFQVGYGMKGPSCGFKGDQYSGVIFYSEYIIPGDESAPNNKMMECSFVCQ